MCHSRVVVLFSEDLLFNVIILNFMQAIALQTLQVSSLNKNDFTSILHKHLGEIGECIVNELSYEEEQAATRNKRQKQCLLEKKLLEEEDNRWEELVAKLIDTSIGEIRRYE